MFLLSNSNNNLLIFFITLPYLEHCLKPLYFFDQFQRVSSSRDAKYEHTKVNFVYKNGRKTRRYMCISIFLLDSLDNFRNF